MRDRLAPLGARVVAVDAAAYFSRPGPRLVEGVELLGHLLHPDLVPAPDSRRSIELDLGQPAPGGACVSGSAASPHVHREHAHLTAAVDAPAAAGTSPTQPP